MFHGRKKNNNIPFMFRRTWGWVDYVIILIFRRTVLIRCRILLSKRSKGEWWLPRASKCGLNAFKHTQYTVHLQQAQSLQYIWNVCVTICVRISKLSKAGNEKYSCIKYIISFPTNPDLCLKADFHMNISETWTAHTGQ